MSPKTTLWEQFEFCLTVDPGRMPFKETEHTETAFLVSGALKEGIALAVSQREHQRSLVFYIKHVTLSETQVQSFFP